jgi:hypothetical protein
MKYLCLVYVDEKILETMTPAEHSVMDNEALAYDQTLRNSGHFVAANALEPVSTATSIRLRGAKVSITDGPFVDTFEKLGGFVLIEAKDLDEAIQIASKIPPGRMGGIEVRPVKELTGSCT